MKIFALAFLALPAIGCSIISIDLDPDMPYERLRVTLVNRSPFPITVEKEGAMIATLKPHEAAKVSWYNTTGGSKPAMLTITWKRGPQYPDRSIAAHGALKPHGAADRYVFNVLDASDCPTFSGGYGHGWVHITDVSEYYGYGHRTYWYFASPKEHTWAFKP